MSDIARDADEIEEKIHEILSRPDPIVDGSGGQGKAYREDGKIKALRWVLGAKETDR